MGRVDPINSSNSNPKHTFELVLVGLKSSTRPLNGLSSRLRIFQSEPPNSNPQTSARLHEYKSASVPQNFFFSNLAISFLTHQFAQQLPFVLFHFSVSSVVVFCPSPLFRLYCRRHCLLPFSTLFVSLVDTILGIFFFNFEIDSPNLTQTNILRLIWLCSYEMLNPTRPKDI